MSLPSVKGLSRLGPRGTLGLALLEVAHANDRVVAMTADLAITAGMERFRTTYPDRFINVGIAEQNLVGVAAGLADDNWIPFAVTFANFAALRACEFVRHHMGYMEQNIKLVGIGAGFAMGQFGNTHYSIEDISALRAIPNLTIVSPADCGELVQVIETCAGHVGPVYIRINGAPSMPIVDQGDTVFKIGDARVLSEESDVVFIAIGSMVARAKAAAELLLDNHGIRAGIINMHTVKPLNAKAVLDAAQRSELIITVEEHSIIGGLGSAVAEILAESGATCRQLRLGVEDRFPSVGSYDYVLAQVGLDSTSIAEKALHFLAL